MKQQIIKLRKSISDFGQKIVNSRFMLSVKKVLAYIPNYLAEHIPFRRRKILWGAAFILPLLIGFVYFFIFPFITSLIYSFSNVVIQPGEGVVSTWVGLNNYKYVFTEAATIDGSFNEILVQAIIDIVFDIPVILIFSLLIAVVLNSKFKGRAFVRAVFFMPVIFNSQAIDLAMTSASALTEFMAGVTTDLFSNMFNFQDYLLQANIPIAGVTFLGNAAKKIYTIVSYSGVQILIFLSAIQSVPKHLYEAAKMEGATQYEMFWKITFPMVSPMMLTAAVYTVVDSFLTSPLVKVISTYNNPKPQVSPTLGTLTNYGINAAMSWVFCLVSVVIIGLVLITLSKAVFYYDE
jgi:ABC-type sugar transport system permease subunit